MSSKEIHTQINFQGYALEKLSGGRYRVYFLDMTTLKLRSETWRCTSKPCGE